MVYTDFIEDNKGFVVFLSCVFIALILTSINIFTGAPIIVKQIIQLSSSLLFVGAFAYFIIWGIRSMWEMPQMEAWEWVVIGGILFIFIFMFTLLTFDIMSFNVIEVVSTGFGMD